jgi:hypothetical protein
VSARAHVLRASIAIDTARYRGAAMIVLALSGLAVPVVAIVAALVLMAILLRSA